MRPNIFSHFYLVEKATVCMNGSFFCVFLVSFFFPVLCQNSWRQSCRLKTCTFHSFVITSLPPHVLLSIVDMSPVSLWPYILFSMHKHCLVFSPRCGVSSSLFSRRTWPEECPFFPPLPPPKLFVSVTVISGISTSAHLSFEFLFMQLLYFIERNPRDVPRHHWMVSAIPFPLFLAVLFCFFLICTLQWVWR